MEWAGEQTANSLLHEGTEKLQTQGCLSLAGKSQLRT